MKEQGNGIGEEAAMAEANLYNNKARLTDCCGYGISTDMRGLILSGNQPTTRIALPRETSRHMALASRRFRVITVRPFTVLFQSNAIEDASTNNAAPTDRFLLRADVSLKDLLSWRFIPTATTLFVQSRASTSRPYS
jgi:hypothetical protein